MDSVVHFEIPAVDMERAKTFYQKAFGWKIEPYMDTYFMAYSTPVDKKYMPTKAGAINGGIQKKDKTIATTRFAVDVKNIDAAIKKAVAAGAKVKQPKTPVGDMLIYAILLDTEGNEVGLAQTLKKE